MWEVEFTDEFEDWWEDLDHSQQAALTGRVELLAERGPDLGRPAVDRIAGSRHHNMKELRASEGRGVAGAVHFRSAASRDLVGGRRQDRRWNEWYEWAIPVADDLYGMYLGELHKEGLIE